jgi:hypothetical protein
MPELVARTMLRPVLIGRQAREGDHLVGFERRARTRPRC